MALKEKKKHSKKEKMSLAIPKTLLKGAFF